MINSTDVQRKINIVKKIIRKKINVGKTEDALALISMLGNVCYETNNCYVDEELENDLKIIADSYKEVWTSGFQKKDIVIFYDGFGFDERGLAQIYLKALCQVKKVKYITFSDKKDSIPGIMSILEKYGCQSFFIENDSKYLDLIGQLNKVVVSGANQIFFYSTPDDVVGTTLLYAYEGLVKRFQINVTDHSFWLGAKCIDKCIEFRDFGASISINLRGLEKEKIVKIPFYPIIHKEIEFQGFPFELKEGMKLVFSGGSFYKTFGDGNKYYNIVDNILKRHENVIFWYAGYGDSSEIRKLMERYPGRVILTGERKDFYQILERSRFYLNTYPIVGGQMYQFAAIAGIVPITLKKGEHSGGFLLEQDKQNVDFTDELTLFAEIDRLLLSDDYVSKRREEMVKSVITENEFNGEVEKILLGEQNDRFPVCVKDYDMEFLKGTYLERLTHADLYSLFVRKKDWKLGIRYYPFMFILGAMNLVKRKNNKNNIRKKG